MITRAELSSLLMDEFEAMKKAFDDDDPGYEDEDGYHGFYTFEFVPYIVEQLDKNNENELKKIFAFVERLFNDGNKYVVDFARVAIVDDLYYGEESVKYREKIYALYAGI